MEEIVLCLEELRERETPALAGLSICPLCLEISHKRTAMVKIRGVLDMQGIHTLHTHTLSLPLPLSRVGLVNPMPRISNMACILSLQLNKQKCLRNEDLDMKTVIPVCVSLLGAVSLQSSTQIFDTSFYCVSNNRRVHLFGLFFKKCVCKSWFC